MISLRSKITQKILNLFFLNKEKRFYINEIAKQINENPSNVHKKLTELKKEGILSDEYQGKERYFFLNKDYPLLKEYKSIVLKKVGLENFLKKELKKIKKIKSVYIFGSYTKDKLSVQSDIDLLIIGNFNTLKLQKALNKVQDLTGREINSIELTPKEFQKRKETDQLIKDIFSNEEYIKVL